MNNIIFTLKEKSLFGYFSILREKVLDVNKIHGGGIFQYGSILHQDYIQRLDELKLSMQLLGCAPFANLIDILKKVSEQQDVEFINKIFDQTVEGLKQMDIYLKPLLDRMDVHQIKRFDEAIHCFQEGCYLSSIVMAVSAVEHDLVSIVNGEPSLKTMFVQQYKMMTLGSLIRFLSEIANDKNFSHLQWISELEPLLKLCNQYRIFSAHPKGKQISFAVAQAILNLSMEFVIEKKIQEIRNDMAQEPVTSFVPNPQFSPEDSSL